MSPQKVGWYRGGCSRWRSEISVNGDGEIEEINFVEILDFDSIYYREYSEWWSELALRVEMYEVLSGM
jgi:hypothetical protein